MTTIGTEKSLYSGVEEAEVLRLKPGKVYFRGYRKQRYYD